MTRHRSRSRSGFWAVAFAFLIVMAFATLPSPLYGLYRERDGLSSFTITVVYAIFAGGTIGALLAVPAIARRLGRRGVMLAAVATMMAAAGPRMTIEPAKTAPALPNFRWVRTLCVRTSQTCTVNKTSQPTKAAA